MAKSFKEFFEELGETIKGIFLDPVTRVYAIILIVGVFVVIGFIVGLILFFKRRKLNKLQEIQGVEEVEEVQEVKKTEEIQEEKKPEPKEVNNIITIQPIQNVVIKQEAPEIFEDARTVSEALTRVAKSLEKVNKTIDNRLVLESPILEVERLPECPELKQEVAVVPKSPQSPKLISVNNVINLGKKKIEQAIEVPASSFGEFDFSSF